MEFPEFEDYPINLLFNLSPYNKSFLTEKMKNNIRSYLDLRYKYCTDWNLLYSTFEHGHSYKAFIDSFKRRTKPFLILIKTDITEVGKSLILGVYLEENLCLSLRPYGTRKVYIFNDKEYRSLKNNDIKIICNNEYLAFGCKDGKYSFLINNTLRNGEISVLVERPTKFAIKYMEVWNIQE